MLKPLSASSARLLICAARPTATTSRIRTLYRPGLSLLLTLPAASTFTTSALTMAPNETALDFVDFVNASPTRTLHILSLSWTAREYLADIVSPRF